MWPVRETVRKCGRTFANQIDLLEKYPDYVFGASSPLHYLFVREHYPALYEKVRQSVRSGRWELLGGMWIEADCNLSGGESLVRQFLYGKNFFRDEFGIEAEEPVAAGYIRLSGFSAADRPPRRMPEFRVPENVLEPNQPFPLSRLPLARHRRKANF